MKNSFSFFTFLCLLQLLFISADGQNKLIPFFSGGAMHHLGKGGVNIEFGGEYEILKHLGVSANYRYSLLVNQSKDKVEVNAMGINLSWILLNKNSNRLSISSGITAGNYYRLTNNSLNVNNPVSEKEYYDIWWNPFRIQYDYTFSGNVMFGTYLGLYGDDGDNSNLIGFVIGYKL